MGQETQPHPGSCRRRLATSRGKSATCYAAAADAATAAVTYAVDAATVMAVAAVVASAPYPSSLNTTTYSF